MKRQLRSFIGTTLIGLMGVTGCAPTQPFFAHEDGDLSHYLNQVQEPDYPDVEAAGLEEAHMAESPKTISNPDFSDTWDLTLEEAISMALHNSKVIRSSGQITQFDIADGLLSRTAAATTVYDPAVTGTNVNNSFFSRSFSPDRNSGVAVLSHDLSPENVETANSVASVESELAEFDALFSARAEWRTGDRAQNSSPIFSQSKNGNFAFGLSKKTATGGAVMIGHGVTYTRSNAILRTLPSDHVAVASLEFRHPLMRGRGTQFNRIPIVLARINEDISTAEFQVAIRNLCLDVENAYWDLQCAYRGVETATTGRDASQRTWSRTYELYKGGGDT
ncbi:MAG: hypothetical protein QF805_07180, partial [Pirellulaceae bacterium]|nr:hypothetical protein [Pirellulaceae bacterium]